MSTALNIRADTSAASSNATHPDLSLGSFASGFSTPARPTAVPNLRHPSSSTAASSAPLSTPPSAANSGSFIRKRLDDALATPHAKRFALDDHDDDDPGDPGGGDVLDTPARDKKPAADGADTPAAALRAKRTRGGGAGSKGGVNLTLRDQEKHIDALKKENFNIKLKVHFLEERLAQLAPDQIDAALKQNIHLKIEVQQRGMEMKKLKKLVLELERELERTQRASGRTRDLEEKLDERDREIAELRRRRAAGVGAGESALREVEARNAELEEQLENARGILEENMDEMDRLREIVERREGHDGGGGGSDRLKRHVEALEVENEDLRVKLEEHEELIARGNEEKEDLTDEVEALRLEIEDLQRRREAESLERSQSRVQVFEEREEREAVEDDLNAVRDKLAAAQIELQQKEDEIEMKHREIEDLVADHDRVVESVEEQWRGEVDDVRGQVEELRDVLEQRDAESKELRLHISEYEANTNDLHEKFEATLAHLERESEEKDAEIEAANREIEKLGQQVYLLEEENDRLKEDSERLREDDAVERERLEALSSALKEKVASLKSELEALTDLCEQRTQESHTHRTRQEELAQHIENLVSELHRERTARDRLQSALDAASAASQSSDDALRSERRALEAKDAALQSAHADLARAQALLAQRDADLAAVQTALQSVESETKKLGESHTTARFSLQLEVDRLRRDVERLEDDLARARRELDARGAEGRERDGAVDRLHAENRELAAQLAAQTQARLNVSEKLDDVQGALRGAEAELGGLRAKAAELEGRLAKEQRALLGAEAQYRDQLTERNTLLLTIYQYMDRILGVDKTPKKNGQAETKPFTNFTVFHDNLITRLKALSQIQLDFDKRCKEAEAKFAEKLGEMRKQLDARWRQLDKFESSLKVVAESKAGWRRKLSAKEGELEALKTTNSELQSIISSSRKPGQGESMEVRSLTARANNAERRIANLQNQLLASEEKMSTMNQKTTAADTKWEARVKEYEARLKAAEEKVKRERQGGKERALELETQAKSYQRQIELAQKRVQQLNEIIESNGLSAKTSSPGR